jgi:hypothetical protein
MGGVLKVAIIGEPSSLDIPMTTATLTYELMWHVNESLFTYDKGFLPIPLLADGDEVTDKGGVAPHDHAAKRRQVPQRQGDDVGRRRPVPQAVGPRRLRGQAALAGRRTEKTEGWDMFSTGFVFAADPALHVSLRCTFAGWWCNEEKERLLGDLRLESDVKKRKAIVDRLQAVFYEEVGSVKLGDYFTLDAARREVRGDFRTAPRMYFWNSWLAK